MPDYSDLPRLVAEFKRAAIDAYMRTQPYAWEIEGDTYVIDSSGAHYAVTRPGEDGEGGGDWSSDNFIANILTGARRTRNGRGPSTRSVRGSILRSSLGLRSPSRPSSILFSKNVVR